MKNQNQTDDRCDCSNYIAGYNAFRFAGDSLNKVQQVAMANLLQKRFNNKMYKQKLVQYVG